MKKLGTFLAFVATIMIVVIAQILVSCNATNTTKGGAIGAGAGGVIGGVIGSKSGNAATGAIIGAIVGGTTGALIGHHMDKQAEELRQDLKGAKVERIGEGILITFNSGLLFDVNSSELRTETKNNLTDLARTLNKYDDTNILIAGHTDSSGEASYNKTLSYNRAYSVEYYLGLQGVKTSRVSTNGYGETQPVASNETETGRQSNRRVEVAIYANNEMKKAAAKGELGE